MPRPSIAEDRRDEILTAFETCVVRQGLAATTLQDVAAEAGQPRPLVRYFLGNRADMVEALITRMLGRGERQLERLRGAELDAAALGDLLFDSIFADQRTNVIIVELWHLALRDAALRTQVGSIYHRIIDEITGRMCAGRARVTVREHDAAYAAVSLAMGSAVLRMLGVAPKDLADVRARGRGILESQ